MTAFESLADSLYSGRPVLARDVATLTSVDWLRIAPLKRDTEEVPWSSAHSLFQVFAKQYLDDNGWYLICLPPGLPFAHYPGAGAITAEGNVDELTVAAEWITFLLDREGRRPRQAKLRVTGQSLPALWRTCVELRSQIGHSFALAQSVRCEYLDSLQRAQDDLASGNPGLLRDFSLKVITPSQSDVYARVLFGALWDLLLMVCSETSESVIGGAWRFPDAAPQILRAKVVLVGDVARTLFLPALSSTDVLRLHAIEWLAKSGATDARDTLLTLLDLITRSHEMWFPEATGILVYALRRDGILPGDWTAQSLIRLILGDINAHVSRRILNKAAAYLNAAGHFDWAARLISLSSGR